MNDISTTSALAPLTKYSDHLLQEQLDCVLTPNPVYDAQNVVDVKFWHIAYCRMAERWLNKTFGQEEGATLFSQLTRDADEHLQKYALGELIESQGTKVSHGLEIMKLDDIFD